MLRRHALHRRYWDRIRERMKRLAPGIKSQHRVVAPPEFIDYWEAIPATLPEKLIFAELVRRQVSFYFSWFFGDLPFTEETEHYRPDFVLPDYRVIIEVAGVYWHTRPGMWEYDYGRLGLLTAAGYAVYIFTDLEILTDVIGWLDTIPGLANPLIRGGRVIIGERPIDPTAALAARLKKWPKVIRTHYRKKVRGAIKPIESFTATGKVVGAPTPPIEGLVTHRTVDQDWLAATREYGLNWLQYIANLTDYFLNADGTINESRMNAEPELYDYWMRWKDWWERLS